MALESHQQLFQCGGSGGCQMLAPVDWPTNADEIWEELGRRPVPVTRNWYPEEHPIALNAGIPHGQTIAQLVEETIENMGE